MRRAAIHSHRFDAVGSLTLSALDTNSVASASTSCICISGAVTASHTLAVISNSAPAASKLVCGAWHQWCIGAALERSSLQRIMVHVELRSRERMWSQNQVKVLIKRESSFYNSSTKVSGQRIFLKFDPVFFASGSVVMLRRLSASIPLLSASFWIGF